MLNKETISPKRQKLFIYIVLAAVTFAVYWQVNQFDFINFDDNIYVSNNIVIQSGFTLPGFLWALSSKYFGLWNPLVWLSFMFDYQLYGLNAGGYHMTNLILHILSTLLLFWLFNRMTGSLWKSAFVAAFFALHPLHVESVAWIAERKDVLSAFFWMLTLCLYVYYVEKPDLKRYLLVICGFVLALMSKPMVVTLPVIMILLDYWPLSRFRIGIESQKGNLFLWQLKEKTLFFILSATVIIITLYNPDQSNAPDLKQLPLLSRLANAPVAFVTYLIKTFWPYDMAIFYPFPAYIPLWQVIGASLLILTITAFVMVMAKRLPSLFTGWFWLVIIMAPVIGIIHIADFTMADRYHYLPSIGIATMLAWGGPLLFKSENIGKKILFPAALIFLITMASFTWKQCGYWKNNMALWNHALKATKDNYQAHLNLASALLEKGEIQKAIDHYNQAIRINNYSAAYYNLGIIHYRLGQPQQAIGYFNEAIRQTPDYGAAYYNRGIVYYELGQYQRSIENYNEAIRLMPDHADAYNNKAFIYLNTGNRISGCSNAIKACRLGICKTLIWARGKGVCN